MSKSTPLPGERVSALAAAISTALVGGLAQAQEPRPSAGPMEEIVVSGSRILRDDYSAPTPVQMVTAEDMRSLGVTSIAEMMTQMPSNNSNFQPDNTGGSAFFVGSTIPNLRGLNTFFGTRTLTLVDSRRFVPTNNGGGVDMSFVPSLMVDRMELVTGGASASYGADAVSGVVNVILDKDLDGVRLEADYGASAQGDGDNHHFAVAGGTDLFAEDRGHLTVSFESDSEDAISNCAEARDWCAEGRGLLFNGGNVFAPPLSPYTPRQPGQPQHIVASDLRRNVSSDGLFWTSAPGEDMIALAASGQPLAQAWDEGVNARQGWNEVVQGGDGRGLYDGVTLRPENESRTLYASFTYDLTDNVELYTELSRGEVTATNFQEGSGDTIDRLCIRTDPFGTSVTNAFVAPGSALEALILSRVPDRSTTFGAFGPAGACASDFNVPFSFFPPQGAVMTKDFSSQIERRVDTDTEVQRFVVGAEGALFGNDRWDWDVYFQYGGTDRSQIAQDYQHSSRFIMAMNSIMEGGQPICSVNSQTPAGQALRDAWALHYGGGAFGQQYTDTLRAGCVPLNPFGQQMTDAMRDYAFGDLTETTRIYQRLVSASFSGEMFGGVGAGPWRVATGIDARVDETRNLAGSLPDPIRTDFALQYGDPWAGLTETVEAFAEFDVPLLLDKPGAYNLSLNLAARRGRVDQERTDDNYPDLVGVTLRKYTDSWKATLIWDPIDSLRIRATRSADVRAPGFRELFYTQTQPPNGFFGTVQNPWLPDTDPLSLADTTDQARTIIGSNPNLDNEQAITETFGIVVTPGDRFQFSADYFTTTIKGGIQYADPNRALNLCFNENLEFYCGLIEFGPPDFRDPTDPRSNIVSYTTITENSQPYTSSGVDFSSSFTTQLAGGGDISLRLLATRTLEQEIVPFEGAASVDVSGQTGALNAAFLPNYQPAPELSGNMFFTYSKNAFSWTTQARYVGAGYLNNSAPWYGPDDPEFDPNLTNTVSDNRLPSWTTYNMSFGYEFALSRRAAPSWADSLTTYLTVRNVTDEDPPFSYSYLPADFSTVAGVGGVNAMYYDTLGRMYQLGLRMQF